MEDVPAFWPVRSPPEPTLAMVGWEEFQVTSEVRFCVLPSLKVPVAVNCWVAPWTSTGLAGVMASEVRVAWVTVSPVEPVTELKLALMVVEPLPTDVAKLFCMVATEVLALAQVANPAMFCVEPSLKVPTAKKVLVVPGAMETLAGTTAMDCSVAEETVSVVEAEKELSTAVMVVLPGCLETAVLPFMVATDVLDEDQVALVRVCVLPSL